MKENNDFLNRPHRNYVIEVTCLLYEPMFMKLHLYKGIYKRCYIVQQEDYKTQFFIEFIKDYTFAEIKEIFSFGHIEVYVQPLETIVRDTSDCSFSSKYIMYGADSYTNMLSKLTDREIELLVKVFDDTGVKYKIFDLEKLENGGCI